MMLIERKLVERAEQLRSLEELLAECIRGKGRVAVVGGSVASGKTALLQAFTDLAVGAGALVLSATASRAEQTLPLGVIGQLLYSTDLRSETATKVAKLLDDGAMASWPNPAPEVVRQATAPILHGLCMTLLGLAERAPLVIAVDDVHSADLLSLQCLSYLVRRLRTSRVLMVLTESTRLSPAYPLLHAELRNPHCRRIQLEPLSRHGVAEILAGRADVSVARADDYHALTGGNPLLLRALLDDCRQSGAPAPAGLAAGDVVVGDAFNEAVLSCLYRYEPTTLQVARALAVVGEQVAPATLGRLLDLKTDVVERAIRLLNRAGLLQMGGFRHRAVRAAILAGMVSEERAASHGRVARLLHSDGAPAAVIARHLVLADRVDAAWMPGTLLAAAEQALTEGDPDHALTCLRMALAASVDQRQRAEITLMIARVRWRLNPSGVLRYLPELVAAVRDGHLTGRHAVVPVHYLLWHGRVDEATDVLAAQCSARGLDPETRHELITTLMWLAYLFPEHTERVRSHWRLLDQGEARPAAETPSLCASTILTATVERGPHRDRVHMAEQVLQRKHLDDDAVGPIFAALSALVFADRLSTASAWCEPLLQEATARGAPTWQALLCAIRAEIAFRQGDLVAADDYAQRGLAAMPAAGWGAAIGSLLSTCVNTAVAAGKHDTAADYLNVPVPAAMYRTPFGLKYLHARGRYYLATDRVRSALSDFLACGETMTAWGLDLPALVPWRTDLAQAYLNLGRRRKSEELAREQLRQLGDGHDRLRGISLRVLAASAEPIKRLPLLREAVDLLQTSGARLELARAFADLGEALQQTGEPSRAQVMMRTAQQIAAQCQARTLLRKLTPGSGPSEAGPSATIRMPHRTTDLSDAERRVASLAALGHTNREIAGKLYLTVSTVEQHLTRVYRKLRVDRRTDLPQWLNLEVADHGLGVPGTRQPTDPPSTVPPKPRWRRA